MPFLSGSQRLPRAGIRLSSLLAQPYDRAAHSFREKMIKGDFNSFCLPDPCTSGHSVLSNVLGSCGGCRHLRASQFIWAESTSPNTISSPKGKYSGRGLGEASSLHPEEATWGWGNCFFFVPRFNSATCDPRSAIKNQQSKITKFPSLHSFFENETPLFPPHMPLISQKAPTCPGYGGDLFVPIRFFFQKTKLACPASLCRLPAWGYRFLVGVPA